jgi:uncharacterized protein (DUF1501 family)
MKATSQPTRREFLSSGAALVAAGSLGFGKPPTTDRFITFINLIGGNDGLNTLIPSGIQAYAQQRPEIAISPEEGLSLDSGPYANSDHVLHPAMPNLASMYRDGFVAFVRMIGYPSTNLSHFTTQAVWSRGAIQPYVPDSGWIARYKDIYAPEAIHVVALGLNQQLDFSGGTTPSTFTLFPPDPGPVLPYSFLGDPYHAANDRLRFQLAEQMAFRARAADLPGRVRTAQLAAYEQFRRQQEAPPLVTPLFYPASPLGSALSSSATMLLQAKPVRIFYALAGDSSYFDTHFGQGGVTGRQATSLGEVDAALAVYKTDLQSMGLWDRAVIVLFSEFGRRNTATGNGTEHGRGGLMIVLGGAVRGGMFGPELTEAAVGAVNMPVAVDFRTVYEELLSRHLGADPAPVFTEAYDRQPPLGLIL